MNLNDFSFLKAENIFVAFLYSDSKEHLIYLKDSNPFDKVYDLKTGCEVAFSDIDRHSVRKYYHNQINYDNVECLDSYILSEIVDSIGNNIDIKHPICKIRNNFVKNYLCDRSQLIDLKNYCLMIKKYKKFVGRTGTLNHYKEITYHQPRIYLKLDTASHKYCFDLFSNEVLCNEKNEYIRYNYYYLSDYNYDIEEYFGGNFVRKSDLINEAYKLIKK